MAAAVVVVAPRIFAEAVPRSSTESLSLVAAVEPLEELAAVAVV